MLYVAYGTIEFKSSPRQYVRNIDGYFDGYFEESWMKGEIPKRIIEEIDKSKLIAPKVVDSPVLGMIPYTWISGGSKTLIMMNSVPGVVYNGDNMGDNCWRMLLELGQLKDIAISLSYYPLFDWPESYEMYSIDTDTIINSRQGFIDEFMKSKLKDLDRKFFDINWHIKIDETKCLKPTIDF